MLAVVALASHTAQAKLKGIYGDDDRRDVYQSSNALHLKLARSTAAMMSYSQLTRTSENSANLLFRSLQNSQNICASERFSGQAIGATCSGFLVGPDTLVTAGHCYESFATPELVCRNFAWVFDFEMKSETFNPSQNISLEKDVYHCKKVFVSQLDENFDYAIIKLDRPVVGREPLKFRKTGKLADNTDLVVIGHPSGLPTKIANAGKILDNSEDTRFATNLDTFHGNSGSAVFDAKTGLLEGILIQGKSDYGNSDLEDPQSCRVVNRCDSEGKNCSAPSFSDRFLKGEIVQRIESVVTQLEAALQ